MDFKKIVANDKKIIEEYEYKKELKKAILQKYKDLVELESSVSKRVDLLRKSSNDFDNLFLAEGFIEKKQNQTNFKIYKKDFTEFKVDFFDNPKLLAVDITVHHFISKNKFKLRCELSDLSQLRVRRLSLKLNNSLLNSTTYEEEIENCNSIKDLETLQDNICRNITHITEGLKNSSLLEHRYILLDKNINDKFKSLKDAFDSIEF